MWVLKYDDHPCGLRKSSVLDVHIYVELSTILSMRKLVEKKDKSLNIKLKGTPFFLTDDRGQVFLLLLLQWLSEGGRRWTLMLRWCRLLERGASDGLG